MKTMEELYKEILESKELWEELKVLTEEALGEFLKKHNCKATAKEFSDYAKLQEEGEIQDNDAEEAVGGWAASCPPTPRVRKDPKEVI